jgi:hypothetical protein
MSHLWGKPNREAIRIYNSRAEIGGCIAVDTRTIHPMSGGWYWATYKNRRYQVHSLNGARCIYLDDPILSKKEEKEKKSREFEAKRKEALKPENRKRILERDIANLRAKVIDIQQTINEKLNELMEVRDLILWEKIKEGKMPCR